MKKRVAVFVNGWNSENIARFTESLFENTFESTIDFFYFICHASYTSDDCHKKVTSSIFELPDLSQFDAAIVFTPGLNFEEMIVHLFEFLRETGIPIISIGRKEPGTYYIGVDNYIGMKTLCNHLIEEHNVKNILFVAGSRENDDSNVRIKAVTDSMMEHGLQFSDKDIFYSNWELSPVAEYVDRMLKEKKQIPDAILCANDFLAESVSFEITKNGYSTPEDIIFTGFDYMYEGRIFYPSISSVDQHYDQIGIACSELLVDIFEGNNIPEETIINCEFFPGESCGCKNIRNEDELRRVYARGIPRRASDSRQLESRLNAVENSFVHAVDYDDLAKRLSKEFESFDGAEGETFYLLMDSNARKLSESDAMLSLLPKFTYNSEMDVIIGKTKGKKVKDRVFQTQNLVPDYNDSDENHTYMFIPLYFESYLFGYAVFCDKISWFNKINFFKFEKMFMQALILYRRNVQLADLNNKLSELMEKDPLTCVKNRIAYERYISKLEFDFNSDKIKDFAVVYFDVNNLKKVNDLLGHERGDDYIRNCCKLICNTFKHSPIFRVGGDEFVAILSKSDYEKRDDLMGYLRSQMEKISKRGEKIPREERVSLASGLAVYTPEIDKEFKSVFLRADELMYENKFIMKNGTDIR